MERNGTGAYGHVAGARSARGARRLDGVDAMYWQVGPSELPRCHRAILVAQGVFVAQGVISVHVTSKVRLLIRRAKYKLIIKLITQIEINLWDEFIKPN